MNSQLPFTGRAEPQMPDRRRCVWRLWVVGFTPDLAKVVVMHTLLLGPWVVPGQAGTSSDERAETNRVVRLGIAQGMWGGVNANDASAAIQAWTRSILQQRGNTARAESRIFTDIERLTSALGSGTIDGASIQSERFLALPAPLRPDHVCVAVKQGTIFERYLVLTHKASGLTNVSSLRGRKVVLHDGPRTSLAASWFETVLGGSAEDPPPVISRLENPSRTVLSVFFRQFDAGLVTSNIFALACELNPQLRRDLRVLALSPEIVPNLFFFRTGYTAEEKDELESAITELHSTVEGRQILTVFQCDRMERQPVSCLESTRQLLAEHERIHRKLGDRMPRLPVARTAQGGGRMQVP